MQLKKCPVVCTGLKGDKYEKLYRTVREKHTMLMQKSILDNDYDCKPLSIKDKILLGASSMFWVWLIIEMVGA